MAFVTRQPEGEDLDERVQDHDGRAAAMSRAETLAIDSAPAAAQPSGGGYPPAAAAWLSMVVLMVTYLFSWLDRSALLLLIGPVRSDFALSDSQISVLTGPAIAVIYAFAAIPLTRLGDIWSRKWVIAAGTAIWAMMTIACGLAHSFTWLVIARMGVGLGEAALTANAYTLTAELFGPNRRGRALSIFVLGQSLGGGIALVAGGALLRFSESSHLAPLPLVGALQPWRLVLVVVGAATLAWIGPVALMCSPRRQPQPAGSTRLSDSLRRLLRRWRPYSIHFAALPLWNLAAYALAAWSPTLFIRVHGWSAPMTGAWLGWVSVVSAIVATIGGGLVVDKLHTRASPALVCRLIALPTLASIPFTLLGALAGQPMLALASLTLSGLLSGSVVVLGPLSLHMITPPGLRGGTTALFLLAANLVGMGGGPLLVALVSDHLITGPHGLALALGLVCSLASLGAAVIILSATGAFEREARETARAGD